MTNILNKQYPNHKTHLNQWQIQKHQEDATMGSILKYHGSGAPWLQWDLYLNIIDLAPHGAPGFVKAEIFRGKAAIFFSGRKPLWGPAGGPMGTLLCEGGNFFATNPRFSGRKPLTALYIAINKYLYIYIHI